MTINSEIDLKNAPVRLVPVGFYAIAVIFNLCLIAQLLTVGVANFVDSTWWTIHIWLVRGYGGLSLLLMGWSFIAPFSPQIRRLSASLPILLGLQYCSIHFRSPLHLEVFHPLIGFALLYVSASLVHRAWRGIAAVNQQNEQI